MERTFKNSVVVLIVSVVWITMKHSTPPKPPHLDPEEWWGPNYMEAKHNTSFRSFKVKFDEQMIKDLKGRLKNRRPFTAPLEGVGFQYGFNSDHLDSWVNYWLEDYPFQEREALLNKFPQYKTNIQGLDIHFIRVKPVVLSNIQVVPLLIIHGWPGSVTEFYEAIPLLTRQAPGYDFVFEVIVPSLPGYGFSDAAVRPGLGSAQVGVIMRNLMRRLGHRKFYVQGGDYGAIIASIMTDLYPDDILGYHTNFAFTQLSIPNTWRFINEFISTFVIKCHLYNCVDPIINFYTFILEETGYMHMHATKPDTIGIALSDSPIGLLTYILEKFSTWTNRNYRALHDGGLTDHFSRDQLIDNVMIYWSTNTITTSMRLYAETINKKHLELNFDALTSSVPTWLLQAKHEIVYHPSNIFGMKFTNLVNITVLEDGGHFIAMEMPEVFTADVFKAVKAFREWTAQNENAEL